METLQHYIAFDLEFNTVGEETHIIQVSAVKMANGQEVDSFDTYVYTDLHLQSFINGLTGITAEKVVSLQRFLMTLKPLSEIRH